MHAKRRHRFCDGKIVSVYFHADGRNKYLYMKPLRGLIRRIFMMLVFARSRGSAFHAFHRRKDERRSRVCIEQAGMVLPAPGALIELSAN
jgi:hypothetical protein